MLLINFVVLFLFFFLFFFFFFFSSRRRHTRYIGDWSSDVCSSDLDVAIAFQVRDSYVCLALGACQPRLDNLRHHLRSEERRVGKECRSRWGADDEKKKKRDQQREERQNTEQNKKKQRHRTMENTQT